MSEEKTITGSCLCGNVQYEVKGPFPEFNYCHCERCRKASGAAHTALIFVKPEQLRWIAGEKDITLFKHPEAENYPRAFCNRCGSSVPRFARDGVRFVVPAGTLHEDPGVRPMKNIFWKLRAPWLVPFNELPTFEERPPKK